MEAKADTEFRQTIIATREKYKDQVLSDQEIIDLVSTGNSKEVEIIVQWLGSGIKESETPVYRFSQILSNSFNKLTPEAKDRILLNGAKFVFSDFPHVFQFKKQMRLPWPSEEVEVEYLGPIIPFETKLKNISEFLARTLEVTANNVQKARKFLSHVCFSPKLRGPDVSAQLFFLYGPKAEAPNSELEKIKGEYLRKNSKLDLLAFWLDADLGNLNPRGSKFDQLLDPMFPKLDNAIKTQVMVFLKEQMLTRKVPRMKYPAVTRFLAQNQSFYEAVQNRYPNSSFLEAYDLTKKVLALDELQEKTKGGLIMPKDLVTLLESNQQLLTYVSHQELENALDRTREHDLALRIERLIKSKKQTYQNIS